MVLRNPHHYGDLTQFREEKVLIKATKVLIRFSKKVLKRKLPKE
jgi:hypothetical protein